MADDEKWGLSREEINKRVRELNQKKKAQGPTRGGCSSGQGVKLLYIRDFLYAHTTKEHPQNANRIQDFLMTKNIEASTKTIYNDILHLQTDFGVPIVYDPKRWGYYITEPEFKPYELRLMVDSMSEAFLQMAGVFSQLELAMIRARVRSGMENARAKGRQIGRPQITVDNLPSGFLRHYPAYKSGHLNISELARVCDLSRTTIYKYIDLLEG